MYFRVMSKKEWFSCSKRPPRKTCDQKKLFKSYLPPVMVCFVDKQKNFAFFHKNSFAIFCEVFKVICNTDKNLRLAADPHIERRKLWESRRSCGGVLLRLSVAVACTIQVVHNSLLLVVKHGMLFTATTLKKDTSSIE